jgi:transcriptional regulator with XRE-family HTH domain
LRRRLAANLLALRLRKGLSQQQLADLAGLSRNYVSELERATRNVSLEVVERLGAALKTDPLRLLRY